MTKKIKPAGYWRDWNHVEEGIRQVEQEIGHFPSSVELTRLGHGGLIDNICNYHGGYLEVRKKMNQPATTKPDGYWKNWKNIRKELRNIWTQHPEINGVLPSTGWMQSKGYVSFVGGIYSNGLKWEEARKKLGAAPRPASASTYKSLESIKTALQKIWKKHIKVNKQLPSNNWLREHGYDKLSLGITFYHEGFVALRKKLNIESRGKQFIRERGTLRGFGELKREINRLYHERPELSNQLPSINWLNDNGYGDIVRAISKYHGGMQETRKILKQKSLRVEDGSWENKKFVADQVQKMFKDHPELDGQIPAFTWMENNGYAKLANSISEFHGGIRKYREEQCTIKTSYKRENGYWTAQKTYEEAKSIYVEHGHFPTQKEFIKMGRGSIPQYAIKYFGGLRNLEDKVVNECGDSEQEKLSSLLEQYTGGQNE